MPLYSVEKLLFPKDYLEYDEEGQEEKEDEGVRVLTSEEISAIREVFLLFDKLGDDTFTVDELGFAMRALGQYPTEEELADIIAEIDADGNKIVEFEEFVDLMARMPPGRQGSYEELDEAFRFCLDPTKDGRMDVHEFRNMMTTMGEPLKDEEINEMMSTMTVYGDGKLKYDQMVRLMTDSPPALPPFLEPASSETSLEGEEPSTTELTA